MSQTTTNGDREANKPEGHDQFTVADLANENARFFDTRGEADDGLESANEVPGVEAELFPPGESPEFLYGDTATDGGDVATEPCGVCGESVAIPDATAGPEGQPSHEACVDADDEPTPGVDECVHCGEPIEDGWCPDCDGDNGTEVIDAAPAPDTDHAPEALSADEIQQHAAELDDRDVGEDPLKWMPGEFVDTIDGTQAINRKGFEVLRYFYGVDLDMEMQVDPEDNDMTHCRYKAVATMNGSSVEAWGTSHVDRGDDPWLLVELAATRARKRAISVATGAGAVAVDELRNTPEGQQ